MTGRLPQKPPVKVYLICLLTDGFSSSGEEAEEKLQPEDALVADAGISDLDYLKSRVKNDAFEDDSWEGSISDESDQDEGGR